MTTWPRKGNSNYKSGLNGNYDLCETSHRSFHSGILNLQIHHENIARLSILGNGELGSQGIRGGQLPLRCVAVTSWGAAVITGAWLQTSALPTAQSARAARSSNMAST